MIVRGMSGFGGLKEINMYANRDGCRVREGVGEFMVLGLIVPVHVRVHSWGKRGKWGTDVVYQTQRPGLQ